MTLSWCVIHDSGWQDDGCFAAEVAEHGDPADCQMVEMELHPVGTRVVGADALVIPAKEGHQEEPIEVGFCTEHHSLAERYPDGSWGCWWECIVEASGNHRPSDFVPLFDALAQSKEGP